MGDETGSSEEETGLDAASAEKEALYPDVGFVLAEIDMLKPPGEALTGLYTSLLLSEITLPASTETTDYVIYDADGHDYGHNTVANVKERVAARDADGFIDDVRSENIRQRRIGLFGLFELATEHPEDCLDAIPLLTTQLQVSETDVRATALAILVELADEYPEQVTPAAGDVILILDSDTAPRLLEAAIRFVATVADRDPKAVVDAAPKLTALLQDDPPAKGRAIDALHLIALSYPDAVVPASFELLDYVKHSDGSERVGALAVLGAIAKEYPDVAKSTIPIATQLLEAESYTLRANAAGLLAELADEYPDHLRSTVPKAIELLHDDDEKARYNATSILARIAKAYPDDVEPAIGPLIETLDEDFPHSRANACWALGYLAADEALEQLEELERTDPNEEVQNAAAFAIDEITGS